MNKYYITVMSIDPDDKSEDPHQKYSLQVEAQNEKEAEKLGREQFNDDYSGLPIHWIKVNKG